MSSDPHDVSVALAPLPQVWDEVRFQKLWLALLRREWRSLAVVGTSKSVDTLRVAELIAKLAWRYRGKPSCVLDFRDLSLRLVEYHKQEMRAQVDAGLCVVIALRPTSENPTAIPIARSADTVALCIDLGVADFETAEQTLSDVGRERVLGAIVLRRGRLTKGTVG